MISFQVKANWMAYQSEVAAFWLTILSKTQRKEVCCYKSAHSHSLHDCAAAQLIIKVRDVVNDILRSYWQLLSLESVRLYHIMTKLFKFLLSKNGQGLLTCFTSPG